MRLVIAEKPSVARDLARVAGIRASGGHCFEGERCVITWCIGHLVELDEPAAYDAAWRSWRLESLPMLPREFRVRGAKHARSQLRAVCDLLRDRRFHTVVNACDAGREGELIFRYVYQYARATLPIQRLWISALTDEAIRRGFAALRPGAQLEPLADAARSRSEADWLVGMNATRAITARCRQAGHEALYSIGRVQTPTLAMLVTRERAIGEFAPRPYWEVRGDFRTADGARFATTWKHGTESRLGTQPIADTIVRRDRAHGMAALASGPRVERTRSRTTREPPPLLFDLTSLQRTANRRFSLSAARTLEIAQALYERHKVLTYPRTDSRHLSTDLAGELPALFASLTTIPDYAPFASVLAASPPPSPRRIFDDAKIADHHAIIPTARPARQESLDRDERRIYDLVVRRFLGAFYPDAEFAITEAWIRVGPGASPTPPFPNESRPTTATVSASAESREPPILDVLPPPPDRYLARGRVRLVAGWQEVAGINADSDRKPDDMPLLPPLAVGQALDGAFTHLAKHTTPPPRYTEATLLGAMESAGKSIDDDALRAAMKDCGLGTPATRAAIIETLLRRAYIIREHNHLAPTATGIALIDSLPVASLASAELTGTWEARLACIARGEDSRASFMADIARYVAETVDAIRRAPPPAAPPPGSAPPAQRFERSNKRLRGGGRGHAPRSINSPPGDGRARSPASTGSPARASTPPAGDRTQRKPPPIRRRVVRDHEPTAPSRIALARRPAVAPGSPTDLPCPACRQATLIAGARGWGCARWRDGCRFVIWFETAGRRLTPSQLHALVTRGKTRKATFEPTRGQPKTGRLVLDASSTSGAARFEPAL